MKLTRLSLLAALAGTTGAFASTADLAGGYQALLYTGANDTGSPGAHVSVVLSSKGTLSGKLTTEDKKVYSFKTKAALEYTATVDGDEGDPLGTASSGAIEIKRAKGLDPLFLNLTFNDFDGTDGDTLSASLSVGETAAASTENGFKVIAKGEDVPTVGSYTMAFELTEAPGENDPAGNGYAIGKVDAKGIMKVAGKLGDGTAFTAAVPSGTANQFAIFANPYKRDGSKFAGTVILSQREDEKFNAETANFFWKKTATEKDKSYRISFDLSVAAMVEPWSVPTRGSNVAELLGIDIETEVFVINLGFDVPDDRQPLMLGLTAKNTLEVKFASSSAPSTFQGKGFAKIFSGKVDPKTGRLTATLNLEDAVTVGAKVKTVKRKVVIEGVLLAFEGELDAFASAFALIPPLDKKTGTSTTARITFDDVQTDPMILKAEAFAGNYQAVFDQQILSVGFPPDGVPANGAVSQFSISSDLRTFTLGELSLPLKSFDPFGGTIIFSDEGFNKKKYNTAIIRFNSDTNALIKCDVFYFQFVGVRSVPPTRSGFALSRNNPSNTIVKLP